MKDGFLKFPRTPHLAVPEGADIRDDKAMSGREREAFLRHELVVEEKVDGANLGISFDADGNARAQNRGKYLHFPEGGQWKALEKWLHGRRRQLFAGLDTRYLLFGEWCYARHSIGYDRLPDWFLGFDLYDRRERRFLCCALRNLLFNKMDIARVPLVAKGRFSHDQLQELLATSELSDQPAEGLYLRYEEGDWLEQRAKLVNPDFVQAMGEHWSKRAITPNRLVLQVAES